MNKHTAKYRPERFGPSGGRSARTRASTTGSTRSAMTEGTMCWRWVRADENPEPQTRSRQVVRALTVEAAMPSKETSLERPRSSLTDLTAIAIANRLGRCVSPRIGIGGGPITVDERDLQRASGGPGYNDFGDQGLSRRLWGCSWTRPIARRRSIPIGRVIIQGRIVRRLGEQAGRARHDQEASGDSRYSSRRRRSSSLAWRARARRCCIGLIAQDPRIRSLASWEAISPAPPKQEVRGARRIHALRTGRVCRQGPEVHVARLLCDSSRPSRMHPRKT